MEDAWDFQLFGRFRLQRGPQTISRFRTQKTAGLLAYLACYRGRIHSRDALVELFWPEAELHSGRHSLSAALSSLRHQLEPPGTPPGSVIVADRWSLELNPAGFRTDVARFEEALRLAGQAPSEIRRAQHLSDALEAYTGALLPGFYDDWVLKEQHRLSEQFLQGVRQVVPLLSNMGQSGQALDLLRRAVQVDPLAEELHVTLMRFLADGGRAGDALRQYRELERILDRELDERPSPATQRFARELEQLELTVGESARPSSRLPTPPRHGSPVTLPAGTVSFLLADIVGSAASSERVGEQFEASLDHHRQQLRREFRRYGGQEVHAAGDAFVVAFGSAGDALACAVAGQRALEGQVGPDGVDPTQVRIAIHSGDIGLEDGEYRGHTLQRGSRILGAAHGGQILCSEATYALVRRDLETDLHLRDLGLYVLRDLDTPERLFQVEYPRMARREFGPPLAPRAHGSNLPVQVTRFFGREQEARELLERLHPLQVSQGSSRLVTLTGPGGTGKTRLAIEVARRLVEPYAGAVWFVSLSDTRDAALMPELVLRAMEREAAPGRDPLREAIEALRRQPSLLILDNLEQLLTDAESGKASLTISALLEGTPGLSILVTSRQLLTLPGEQEYPVLPLPAPGLPPLSRSEGARAELSAGPGARSNLDGSAPRIAATPEELSKYDSVRLFVDRAQAVKPDFQITGANAPAVAELCCRLEGIPLALELAAARVQVLTPGQMLQQLTGPPGGRFTLLTSRKRGLSDRQRALASTIEWSYRLLSPPLQRMFSRISVLCGTWDLEAVEAITAEPLALDYLTQLRECSLVQTTEWPCGIRFSMLETIREYAAAQLTEDDYQDARRRHAEYFLSAAEAAEPYLRGEDQATWLDRLESDQENFRAALRGSLATNRQGPRTGGAVKEPGECSGEALQPRGAPDAPLRFCKALWYFWSIRGHLTEGRRVLSEVLAEAPAAGLERLRAWALTAAGALAHDQADYPAAHAFLTESIELWRTQPAPDGLAQALNCLGNVLLDQNQGVAAVAFYEEALGLYRADGNAWGMSTVLSNLGVHYLEVGALDRAAELLEESIGLKRQLGNRYGLSNSLESLANLERCRRQDARAFELCREALQIRRELGHQIGIAMSLNNLGHLLLESGDLVEARAHLLESTTLFQELEQPRGLLESLTGLAGVAAAAGNPEWAGRLLGAAAAGRQVHDFATTPCEERVIARCRQLVNRALGPERYLTLEAAGRRLALQEALAEARNWSVGAQCAESFPA